jgi:ATP-dependent exoDNAse (exonuclease V) alpha subunit
VAVTATNQQQPTADQPLRELRGVVERITYQNPENGCTVARLAPERAESEAEAARGDDRLVTVVGTLADLTHGEAIVAHGWWRNDPKHGWQFQAKDYRTALPATLQGMKKYLGSGLVKGVGPVNVGRIVDAFGEATFEVIDADPTRLGEVDETVVREQMAEIRRERELLQDRLRSLRPAPAMLPDGIDEQLLARACRAVERWLDEADDAKQQLALEALQIAIVATREEATVSGVIPLDVPEFFILQRASA